MLKIHRKANPFTGEDDVEIMKWFLRKVLDELGNAAALFSMLSRLKSRATPSKRTRQRSFDFRTINAWI